MIRRARIDREASDFGGSAKSLPAPSRMLQAASNASHTRRVFVRSKASCEGSCRIGMTRHRKIRATASPESISSHPEADAPRISVRHRTETEAPFVPGRMLGCSACRQRHWREKFLAVLFSAFGPATPGPTRPPRQIDRQPGTQVQLTPIGKFEISQMDAKSTFRSATAFDDVARADWKPVGETIGVRMHAKPPVESPGRSTNPGLPQGFRRNSANPGDCCGSVWIGADADE
jgi:hypothetical protein